MGYATDYWQREAGRYDAASRSLMSRVRTEIALGVTVLSSIVALVVVNEAYPFLIGVPILATAIWALVLWSMQESFLLDAHLMYAERMMARNADLDGVGVFPTWEANGGRVGRFGYVLRLVIAAWGIATLVAVGSCAYFAAASSGFGALFTILVAEFVVFSAAVGYGAYSADRAGARMFQEFRARLDGTAADNSALEDDPVLSA